MFYYVHRAPTSANLPLGDSRQVSRRQLRPRARAGPGRGAPNPASCSEQTFLRCEAFYFAHLFTHSYKQLLSIQDMLDAAPDAGHSSEESARSLLLGSCSRAAGGGAAQVRVWHGQGREGRAGWQEGGEAQDRRWGLLLLSVSVFLQVATRCHKALVLVDLGGGFPFRESNYFFFQRSSLLFKLHSLFLVNSFKLLKFGLQL